MRDHPPPAVDAPAAPRLTTPRLLLRPLRADDAGQLLALDADPEVRRFVHLPSAPTRAELEAALPTMLERFGTEGSEPHFWAVEEPGTRIFLGWLHLRPVPGTAGILDLGYRFRREVWGRGYASEAAAALVERAFARGLARRVEARALAENLGSIRVMERVGMRLVETFAHEGAPAVAYALDRGDHDRPTSVDHRLQPGR